MEGIEISHILPSPTCAIAPITDIPHQNGIFVIIDEPTLTLYDHPKSIAYLRVHFGVGHSTGLANV